MNNLYWMLAGAALSEIAQQAYTRGWFKLAYEWVKSKREIKPVTLLDAANAAPEASPADKKSFWMTATYIGVGLFGLVAIFLASIVWYKSFSKEAPITRLQPPAVVTETTPIKPTVKPSKQATKPTKQENKSESKPPEKQASKPVSKESLPTEFDKQLAEFEARIKKEFP